MSDKQVDAVIILVVFCIAVASFSFGVRIGRNAAMSNTVQSCNDSGKALLGDTVIKCEVLVE